MRDQQQSGENDSPPSLALDGEVARRQALFREVNDRIEHLNGHSGRPEVMLALLCECGSPDCTDPIEVPNAVYDWVRALPSRFVLKDGHQREQDSLVMRQDGYLVAEKGQ